MDFGYVKQRAEKRMLCLYQMAGCKQHITTYYYVVYKRLNQLDRVGREMAIFRGLQCDSQSLTHAAPLLLPVNTENGYVIVENGRGLCVNCVVSEPLSEELRVRYGCCSIRDTWQEEHAYVDRILSEWSSVRQYHAHMLKVAGSD